MRVIRVHGSILFDNNIRRVQVGGLQAQRVEALLSRSQPNDHSGLKNELELAVVKISLG